MDIFTHLVVGALVYIFFFKEITFNYILIAVFSSILVDLDVFLSPLKRIFKSKYLEHRGGSHSYIIGIFASFNLSLIYSILTNKPFFKSWGISSLFYALHVSMDLLTTTKIPIFYPISKREHSFYIEKAGSQSTMLNSLIFLITFFIFTQNSAEIQSYLILINFFTYFFFFYYLYRIFSKIIIVRSLSNNQKYFPGVLPFYFYIFEDNSSFNTINARITKKSHFLTEKQIIQINEKVNENEMYLFNQTFKEINNDYYFAKWTKFPVINRNHNIFTIKLFFLEIMVHGRSLHVKNDYDISSQKLITSKQTYGPFKS